MLTPQTLTFDIPNADESGGTHRLICHQWGNPHAPRTILCVHGLTRNGRDFDFLAKELAHDSRVLCPDMPGRGKSEWLKNPAGYNNAAYIGDLTFMLRSLGIAQVDWIGTSMGGILGMTIASAAPGLIRSLILNDVGCIIPASGLSRILSIANVKTVFSSRAEAEEAFRMRTTTFGITDEGHWRHLLAYGIEPYDGKFRFTYDPALFAVSLPKDTPVADVNLWPLWDGVAKLPVLLIRGMQSDILKHETAVEMRTRHSRLMLREIENTGHAPALMDDKQIALIQEWMSAII